MVQVELPTTDGRSEEDRDSGQPGTDQTAARAVQTLARPCHKSTQALHPTVLFSASMELFFNLMWLATSLLLVAGWIWSIHKGYIEFEWTTFIALALLIVILFPVISMTDDMVVMRAPAEVEHMLRSSERPLAPVAILGFLSAFAAIALST